MAILKHIASKNANYAEIQRYIMFEHDEDTNKPMKAKNKGQFRQEHTAEIALYEAARKFLKEQSADGQLPSMKLLKAEKQKSTDIS